MLLAVPRSRTESMATAASSSTSAPSEASRAQEEARAALLASLHSTGSVHDAQFQRRAQDLHTNAASISKQEVELQRQTKALAKESAKWQKELDKGMGGLKDVGDVQNWAEMMERDLLVLEETIRLAEGGEETGSASGGSQWR